MKKYLSFRKGFTLIELLVVIAVLGVLATAIVAVINPLEKIAKAKDSTKKSTVSQLTNALQSYYTLKGQGTYPPASSTWIDTLVSNGDLKSVPPPAGGTACTTNNQNGYCYKTNAAQTEAIVYAGLETSERPPGTSGTTPFTLWSSASGESGTYYSVSSDVPDTVTTSGFISGPSSTLTQGLAGWWKMNENANDSSGNGNNGAVSGASLIMDKNNNLNNAYGFNGTNNYINFPSNSSLNFQTDFSVGLWIKLSGISGNVYAVTGGSTDWPSGKYRFQFAGNRRPRFAIQIPNSWGIQGPTLTFDMPLNEWHQLVGVWKKNQQIAYIYYDGNYNAQASTPGIINLSDNGLLTLGALNSGFYFLNGALDDVRVYNRALSAAEVSNLFSLGPQ